MRGLDDEPELINIFNLNSLFEYMNIKKKQ